MTRHSPGEVAIDLAGVRRVLVVEDDPTVAEVLLAYLRRAGFAAARSRRGHRTWSRSTSCCPGSTAWRSAVGSGRQCPWSR